jgi:polysaccharide pyruvyl transferase WcaK-like protein
MTIEIVGGHFGNKGAHLMLVATAEHYAELYPHVRLVVKNVGDYVQRARLGLHQKLWSERLGSTLSDLLGSAIPKRVRRVYGLVLDREVDAVLDISGFRYSDQWEPEKTERAARLARHWKRAGRKVVLMPQAFGPFERRRTRDAFRVLLDHVDLAYARDSRSYEFARSVAEDHPGIRLAPDFTNLVPGRVRAGWTAGGDLAGVVPNIRMVDKTDADTANAYVAAMAACTEELLETGHRVVFVLHQVDDDVLAKRVCGVLGRDLEIVRESDPVVLKGILGSCRAVVGSRYHALISALAQGVPCLGMGWSHKYQALFEDYDSSDFLVSPRTPVADLRERVRMLVNGPDRDALVERIRRAAAAQQERALEMWREVDALVMGTRAAQTGAIPESAVAARIGS